MDNDVAVPSGEVPAAVVPADLAAGALLTDAAERRAYHHGRLAEALVDAAEEMARAGGPDAVVLREAARRVGVSATAAYRHFDGQTALLHAVKERALAALATRMRVAIEELNPPADPLDLATARLAAIGHAYLGFAIQDKGLFECFCLGLPIADDVPLDGDTPGFGLLTAVMDELVAAGGLDPARRPGADIAAWAAVHGLAVLTLDGALAAIPGIRMEDMYSAAIDMVLVGLLPRPGQPTSG